MAGQVEGFFIKYRDTVNKSIDGVIKNNFVNLETNSRRVQYLCSLPAIKDYDLTKDLVETDSGVAFPVQKEVEKARQLKNEGNNAVKKGDWSKALELYSQSLLYMSPKESEEYAIILANRSAALYFLEEYEDCILDVDRCLCYSYPRHLRYKVMERKARALHILKRNEQAIVWFHDTLAALEDANLLDSAKRDRMHDETLGMAKMLQNAANMTGNPSDSEPPNRIPPRTKLSGNISSRHPATSTAVQIDHDVVRGRYATARRDIQAGEVIVVEAPYSSVLLAEYSGTHCQNCFSPCQTLLIPCPNCTNVIFCSDKCKDRAVHTYHRYECPILPLIWRSGCSITCHIALRMVTQNSKTYFEHIYGELDKKPSTYSPYFSHEYRTVYQLVSHEDRRSMDDLFHRTQMTAFLLKLLEISGYFQPELRTTPVSIDELKSLAIDERYKDDIGLIGSLLLRNLQVLQFNAHEVSELKCKKPKPGKKAKKHKGKSMFIGGAIYPTLALFNHSCDPSIVRYFTGSTTIVRTVKFIKTGEEISENYGPIFTIMPKEQRLTQLKEQYWFDCKCIPCEQNWPLYEDMSEDHIRFRCNSCSNMVPVPTDCTEFVIKCEQCQQPINILKGLKSLQETDAAFQLGKDAMEKGKYDEAITKFVEVLKLFDETLCTPYRSYYDCVQELRRCMLSLGNYRHV